MKNNFHFDPNSSSNEYITVGAVSGDLTTVAAGGDVFGHVNLNDAAELVLGIRIRVVTKTAFASAQGLAFRVNKVTGFTGIHNSGGTAVQAHYNFGEGLTVTRAGAAVATGDRVPLTELSSYISNTGAISGATYTAEDTDEPEVFAVGAGSTLPGVYEDCSPPGGLWVLPKNTGIVVNNHILMGASGVVNLFIGLDIVRRG
jgi:hypothetical protein